MESPDLLTRLRRLTPLQESLLAGGIVVALYIVIGPAADLVAGAFNDDAVYLSLGKAIASGEGYRSIYTPGDPVHLKYPPGLPALYAIFWLVAGNLAGVMLWVRLANLLAVGLSAGMIWWLARHRYQADPVLTAILALGPLMLDSTVHYFSIALSEPYYLAGWLAVLVWYAKWKDGPAEQQGIAALVTGILVAVTVLMRAQALVIFPAILVAALWDGRERRSLALFSAAGIFPVAGWSLWHSRMIAGGPVSTQPGELSYLEYAMPDGIGNGVGLLWDAVTTNVVRYLSDLAFLWSDMKWLGYGLVLLVGVTALISLALQIRGLNAMVLTLGVSALTVLAWPFTQDRLVIALLPVAGVVLAIQLSIWVKGPSWRRATILGALGLLTASVTVRQVNLRTTPPTGSSERPPVGRMLRGNSEYLLEISEWVRANTAAGENILAEPAPGLFLHTGRKSVSSSPPRNFVRARDFEEPGEFLARRILQDGIDVLIVGDLSGPMAAEVARVFQDCRGSIAFVSTPELGERAAVYRITEDRECLAGISHD